MPTTAEIDHRRRVSRLVLLALCAFVSLYVFPYFPGINNPNENVRFYMTASIVDSGTYEISGARARFGWTNDAASPRTPHAAPAKAAFFQNIGASTTA